jgi:Carbohydrate family 9 binding domain-like
MIGVVVLAGLALALQDSKRAPEPSAPIEARVPPKAATDTGVAATRADVAPVIDGKDDDAVWREAPVASNFKMWRPTEGKEPRAGFKTEARIAYDASNLYVYVRAFDPHPDSIITLLERRDTYTS